MNRGITINLSQDIYGWHLPELGGDMGQRVELSTEDAGYLTEKPRILERRGDKVIVEMPEVVEDVSRREMRRILRRFRWLLGQRWGPQDD